VHHVVLDRWSRRDSIIHRLDPRAKIAGAAVLLLGISVLHPIAAAPCALFLVSLLAIILAARLPLGPALARAAIVLPFSTVFGLAAWMAGDPARAISITVKSYLSCLCVLALVATTPLPALLRGLEWLRVPTLLITVAQFLYRYLFVISEQAQHMMAAARCRGAQAGARRIRFQSAAGALGVLFARSYARAEGVQRAMAARGYSGRFPSARLARSRAADLVYVCAAAAVAAAANLLATRPL
jgi:cobalt/nickel transport system permease protein